MRRLLFLFLLIPSVAFADECQETIKRFDKLLQIVGNARNVAEARVASLQVELEQAKAEIERLSKEKKEVK